MLILDGPIIIISTRFRHVRSSEGNFSFNSFARVRSVNRPASFRTFNNRDNRPGQSSMHSFARGAAGFTNATRGLRLMARPVAAQPPRRRRRLAALRGAGMSAGVGAALVFVFVVCAPCPAVAYVQQGGEYHVPAQLPGADKAGCKSCVLSYVPSILLHGLRRASSVSTGRGSH